MISMILLEHLDDAVRANRCAHRASDALFHVYDLRRTEAFCVHLILRYADYFSGTGGNTEITAFTLSLIHI